MRAGLALGGGLASYGGGVGDGFSSAPCDAHPLKPLLHCREVLADGFGNFAHAQALSHVEFS